MLSRQRRRRLEQMGRVSVHCLCLFCTLMRAPAPLVAQPAQAAKRALAERAEAEAERLMKQGTAEALRQAIAKYEEARRGARKRPRARRVQGARLFHTSPRSHPRGG
jgi:hypothetical protein